ncbi:MAG TPA: aspartyl protease family protein [Sphingorhabdus sp.]|nr:aspartyl protease family protein [Sphingorhabdus sp.]
MSIFVALILSSAAKGNHIEPSVPTKDACAAEINAAEALFQIPFRVIDGRIYVDVHINGQGPFPFAVDTGASGLGRGDSSLVKTLALPITNRGQSSDGVNVAAVDMTRFESLEIGGYRQVDMEVITRDYSSRLSDEAAIAGIIGRDFFADGTLVIDYPAQRLSFTRAVTLTSDTPNTLAYERPFRVQVQIGSHTTEGQLDTGANVEFVMPRSLFDQVSDAPLTAAENATLTNTSLETQVAKVAGPFRFGGGEIANANVRVSDRFPELLVGARVLQKHKLMIDQRSKLIAICPKI